MTLVTTTSVAIAIAALSLAAPVSLVAQQAQQATAAQSTPSAPPGFEIPKDMTTYYVALYVRGPKFMADDSPDRQALTRRHLSYIRRMIEEKKYVFAGPLLDEGDKQGLAIVSAASAEEARRIAESDPAIAAGHMAIELHPAMLPSLKSVAVKY
jgi:uncharacterized protein YciI